MTDTPPVDPLTHKWWIATRAGEHGHDCRECRRATGGPGHTKEGQ